MAVSPPVREALIHECDGYCERAALAYRDGDLVVALAAADRALAAVGELFEHDPGDRSVVEVLAERLRDRAEIRLVCAAADPSAPWLVQAYDQAQDALAADPVGGHYDRIRAIRTPTPD